MNRLAQLKLAFDTTREHDPRALPLMVVAGVLGVGLPIVVGAFSGGIFRWIWIGIGVLLGPLVALSVLARRASKVQMTMIEGQPGAATAVVNALRGDWRVTPAVGVTAKQDMVHRVIGPPGIVVLGEGNHARLKPMLEKEKKRMARAAGEVPIHVVSVGDGEDQTALRSLRMRLMRLPRKLKKGQIADVDRKLSALASSRPPMPKGAVPKGRPPRHFR